MPSFSPRDWLDIRPHERRVFWLSVLGAFFVLAFATLSRALREAFFLEVFAIDRLPWMTAAVVLFSVPAVNVFGRKLGRGSPRRVLIGVGLVFALGVCGMSTRLPEWRPAVVAFYLWTAVGALLLTSGFWMVIAEHFPLRDAKRLFGLIGGGGTLGAMAGGASVGWLTGVVEVPKLILILAGLLILFLVTLVLLPRRQNDGGEKTPAADEGESLGTIGTGKLVWRNPTLRAIAGLIFFATLATNLLDFRFKELARAATADGPALASYLGAFYGVGGGVALFLQIVLTGRLVNRFSVTGVLLIVPAVLIFGGAGLLLMPGLVAATLVRGADYSLRKSIYRSATELLYIPVKASLRRRTKTFIDSVVDSAGEGVGAVLVLLWIGPLSLASRTLAVPVLVCALCFWVLSRRMRHFYVSDVGDRLREEHDRAHRREESDQTPATPDLLSVSFARLDLRGLHDVAETTSTDEAELPVAGSDLVSDLSSPDEAVVLAALARVQADDPEHLEAMTRLIARDSVTKRIIRILQEHADESVPTIVEYLQSDTTDFVIRRRLPDVLATVGGTDADAALLDALGSKRFEVRYRAAVALVTRRKHGLPTAEGDWTLLVWQAISREVAHERPLWELQKLLDDIKLPDDDLVTVRAGTRGELSLEHTFRLLSLVLEPQQVQAAYHGVILDDDALKSYALEYLEHVLPASVRHRLWVFIGDFSDKRRREQIRTLDDVVADLMLTGQTVFGGDVTRRALKRLVDGDASEDSVD